MFTEKAGISIYAEFFLKRHKKIPSSEITMAFERLEEILDKKVKGIAWEMVKSELISNADVQAAYEVEERKERLQLRLQSGAVMLD